MLGLLPRRKHFQTMKMISLLGHCTVQSRTSIPTLQICLLPQTPYYIDDEDSKSTYTRLHGTITNNTIILTFTAV
jgi:hypothetical protein